MNPEARAAAREANRIKNQKRKETRKRHTLYAEQGRELRKHLGGAFGKTEPALYNACAEGTTAIRRAENKLEEPEQ